MKISFCASATESNMSLDAKLISLLLVSGHGVGDSKSFTYAKLFDAAHYKSQYACCFIAGTSAGAKYVMLQEKNLVSSFKNTFF